MNAIVLSINADSICVESTNIGATASIAPFPQGTGTGYIGGDVWFSFVAPASGHVIISTASTITVPTITAGGMALYSGTCGADMTQLALSTDGLNGSFMPRIDTDDFDLVLTEGVTYYLRFWAYENSESGTFNMCIWDGAICTTPIEYDFSATACDSYTWNGQTYTETGDYVQIFTAANGCDSIVTLHLTIQMPPFSIYSNNSICIGGTNIITVMVPESITQSVNDTFFIPDGVYCSPYGYVFHSDITFDNFSENDSVESIDDILSVCVNMEHSFLGDVRISLQCPNGQSVDLLPDYQNWPAIGSSSTWLGFASEIDDSGDGCDGDQYSKGIGWNYCWSNTSDQGYVYASSPNGFIFETDNVVQANNPFHGSRNTIDSTNKTEMSQVYHPVESFENLIGCPMNGTWSLEVQDTWGMDNGFLFGWEMTLNNQIDASNIINVTCEGSFIDSIYFDEQYHISITPPMETPIGNYDYQINVSTADGCDSTVILHLTTSFPVTHEFNDTACESYTWNDATYTESGDYVQIFPATNGCDSTVTLHLTIITLPIPTFSVTPDFNCDEMPNGSITINNPIGTEYEYSIDSVDFQSDTVFSNLTSGEYNVIVRRVNTVCSNSAIAIINSISGFPVISIVTEDSICSGENSIITILANNSATVTRTVSDTIFVPDGVSCQPYGNFYRSPLTIDDFSAIDFVESADDILSVCVNMEHSFLGDVRITLQCPNGQSVDLLPDYQNTGWPTSGATSSWLGFASEIDDSGDGCDGDQYSKGIGWNYCWSNTSDQGYVYASSPNGFIFETDNVVQANNPFHGSKSTIDSTNKAAMSQVYHPVESFDNLIGCPMNGTWFIEVQDTWGIDNGFLFGWDMTLSNNVDASNISDVTCEGPFIDSIYFDEQYHISITPPMDTPSGNYDYQITLLTESGCDSTVMAQLKVNDAVMSEFSAAACYEYVWNEETYTQSGDYIQHFQNVNTCDSAVTLHLTIYPSYEIEIDDAICLGEDYTNNGFEIMQPDAGSRTEILPLISQFGCDSIIVLRLTINELPTIDIFGVTEIEQGSSTTLTAFGAATYLWSTGETTASITVSPSETTDYSVVGIDENNCEGYKEVSISVLLGVAQIDATAYKIYPNPANASVIIEGNDIQSVEIFNSLGKRYYETKSKQKNLIINTKGFESGVYIVRIKTMNGNIITKRLVIER